MKKLFWYGVYGFLALALVILFILLVPVFYGMNNWVGHGFIALSCLSLALLIDREMFGDGALFFFLIIAVILLFLFDFFIGTSITSSFFDAILE